MSSTYRSPNLCKHSLPDGWLMVSIRQLQECWCFATGWQAGFRKAMEFFVKWPPGWIIALIFHFAGAVLKKIEGNFSSNAALVGKNRHYPLVRLTFVNQCFSPSSPMPTGLLSLKVVKGRRSIEAFYVSPPSHRMWLGGRKSQTTVKEFKHV